MTPRTKGRLPVVALVVLLGASATLFASSERVRVRYWAWRLHSSNSATRHEARLELLRRGREVAEPWLAEIIAGDLRDRARPGSEFFTGNITLMSPTQHLIFLKLDRDVLGRRVDLEAIEDTSRQRGDAVLDLVEALGLDTRRIVARWPLGTVHEVTSSRIDRALEPAVLAVLREGGPR